MPVGAVFLDALNRVGFGGVVLDTSGEVITFNLVSLALLKIVGQVSPGTTEVKIREAVKSLLRSPDSKRFRVSGETWAIVPSQNADLRGLVIHAMPISPPPETGPHTILVIIDLDDVPAPGSECLSMLFGLSPAEARLAIHLARGKRLEEIADNLGVKLATVRKQLAAVFEKTRTRRQGELVALLGRLSILP